MGLFSQKELVERCFAFWALLEVGVTLELHQQVLVEVLVDCLFVYGVWEGAEVGFLDYSLQLVVEVVVLWEIGSCLNCEGEGGEGVASPVLICDAPVAAEEIYWMAEGVRGCRG